MLIVRSFWPEQPMLVRRGDSLLTRCSFNVKSGVFGASSSSSVNYLVTRLLLLCRE